jgi:hypothetical protein
LSTRLQKKTQQELVEWRRAQVIQLISKGKNLTQIAEVLKVDVSTVCRDYQYIRENANMVLKKYLAETVPLEVTKCLSRLNAISNEAWKMAEHANASEKTKISALSLAQEAALHIVNVVTNNKPLIDEAFQFAENDDHEHSIASRQESNSLNNKREGDEKEEEEEYNNRELSNKSFESEEESSAIAAAENTVF